MTSLWENRVLVRNRLYELWEGSLNNLQGHGLNLVRPQGSWPRWKHHHPWVLEGSETKQVSLLCRVLQGGAPLVGVTEASQAAGDGSLSPAGSGEREQWLCTHGCYSKEQAGKETSVERIRNRFVEECVLAIVLCESPNMLPVYILENEQEKTSVPLKILKWQKCMCINCKSHQSKIKSFYSLNLQCLPHLVFEQQFQMGALL